MQTDALVVGGGAAGVDAATALRRQAPNASVTLVSPGAELLYRPWLVYLPASAVPFSAMSIPLVGIASRHGFNYIQDSVRTIEIDANRVILASGDQMSYRYLVLAPGASADRGRIPGADEHALFPCDAPEAMQLLERVGRMTVGTVAFVLTGERIGPGLEYAGWLGRAVRQDKGRSVRVVLIEDGDAMDKQFGSKAAGRLGSIVTSNGVEVVRHARIERIESDKIVLDRSTVAADLVAITSPLRGPDLGLPPDVLDERAMLTVDRALRVRSQGNIFAAGDFANVQDAHLPKTWIMARMQAAAAARNVAAALSGNAPRDLNMRKVARMAAISMPDVGGTTLFVRNRRPVVAGRWPLAVRYRMDGRYLARYRTEADVTRPSFTRST